MLTYVKIGQVIDIFKMIGYVYLKGLKRFT